MGGKIVSRDLNPEYLLAVRVVIERSSDAELYAEPDLAHLQVSIRTKQPSAIDKAQSPDMQQSGKSLRGRAFNHWTLTTCIYFVFSDEAMSSSK
jgi:hypothetical protein